MTDRSQATDASWPSISSIEDAQVRRYEEASATRTVQEATKSLWGTQSDLAMMFAREGYYDEFRLGAEATLRKQSLDLAATLARSEGDRSRQVDTLRRRVLPFFDLDANLGCDSNKVKAMIAATIVGEGDDRHMGPEGAGWSARVLEALWEGVGDPFADDVLAFEKRYCDLIPDERVALYRETASIHGDPSGLISAMGRVASDVVTLEAENGHRAAAGARARLTDLAFNLCATSSSSDERSHAKVRALRAALPFLNRHEGLAPLIALVAIRRERWRGADLE